MIDLGTVQALLQYSDWANGRVLDCSRGLADDALDRPFDIGMGSLRRTLLHIWAGEHVWLRRWKGLVETPWPSEVERIGMADLADRFRQTWAERAAFLTTLSNADLPRVQVYRDSKGSLFRSSLGDMLLQGCIHSTHHRAQAANLLRRLEAESPELDYMMWLRQPA